MRNKSILASFLELAQRRIENQHSVLWKVETHYTWLVYIIAGGLAFVWLSVDPNLEEQGLLILRFGSILGLVLSLIGFYVVRLEGDYLHEDHQIYRRTVVNLPELYNLHPEGELKEMEFIEAKNRANKSIIGLFISILLNILISPVIIFMPRKCSRRFLRWLDRIGHERLFGLRLSLTVRDAFQITLLLAAMLFILAIYSTFRPDATELIFGISHTS